MARSHLPFLETLNLLDLLKLMNDPMLHDLTWKLLPIKIPSYMPMFEGKIVEDLGNHVMTFHLW